MNVDSTTLSLFWTIFSFSFIVAMTGAMAPGPLLTYTIIRAAGARRRGYLVGVWVIAGHALLEMGIIILLLLGFSALLKHAAVVKAIGLLGGSLLIYLGYSVIRDVVKGRMQTDLFADTEGKDPEQGGMSNPVLGGIFISMSNPYWWIWWATIGFAFMVRFEVSFANWPGLLAFFLGHEAGDLLWYLIVSTLSFFGLRRLSPAIYSGILVVCGALMVFFGLFLGLSPFLQAT